MTCIYCDSPGPFTEEHVVPAGMGGDDKDWVLKGVVCGTCNTVIFSPLEAKLMRSSPLAVARLFSQTRSRDRGPKTAAPSLQASVSYFDDPDSGMLLEQEIGSQGQSTILPQVIATPPNKLGVTGADVASANQLVADLGALPDELTMCEKGRGVDKASFTVTDLIWCDGRYVVGKERAEAKPPKGAIWLEPLERPATTTTSELAPRVFRRTRGPLVCRADSVAHAAVLLGWVRTEHASIVVPAETPTVVTPEPGLHFRQVVDWVACDRAMTKIAFNLCAHIFGADAVREPAFDRARAFVHHGEGRCLPWPPELVRQFADRFPKLPHHHLMVLAVTAPNFGEPGHVSVILQFYGGRAEAQVIALGTVGVPVCPEPIFVVVDYEGNSTRRYSSAEFALRAAMQRAGNLDSFSETMDTPADAG